MTLEILVNAAVRMLLVGTAAWLALRIVRVRNPHVEVLVWRMVLLAGLALPVLLYFRLAPSFATSFDLPMVGAAGAGGPETPAAVTSSLALQAGALPSIYLGAALLLLGRLVAGLIGMWRVSRVAQPMSTPGDVRISGRVRSPATFGTTILLPADAPAWPADRLDAVLAHERAHVRARDGYWSWLAQLNAAVFWFSPLSWWLQRRLEALAETTSDDAVVAARHDPIAYAALLLEFARRPNSRSVAMSVAESNVPKRIERLLARIPPAAALPRVARWIAFVLLIPVAVFAAATTRAAPPTGPAAPEVPVQAAAATAVRIVKAPDIDNFYPSLAKAERVTGSVVVKVAVDPLGQLVKVEVVDVQPVDPRYGFADAAIQVAQNARYANPSQKDSSLTFMVKFALED